MRTSTQRKLARWGAFCVMLYLSMSPVWRSASYDVVVRRARPHDVFEFVADLNNAKLLNPSMQVPSSQHGTLSIFWPASRLRRL